MDTARVRSWTVLLQPGDVLDYRPEDWADTLLVIDCGELEVECRSGQRARFGAGAVLTLAGLPLQRLRNCSAEPLVLRAAARQSRR
ncbi:MAG TPA: hypothetical protein VF838_06060 [Trebonia sp.]